MRFIVGEIVFFNIVGNFGNFQVIYLNCKSKRLQSKSATLQCILSLFQSFCLLSTLHNAFGILEDETYTRRECYPLLAPYVFFICFQAVLMLLLPIDMLFAILAPHRYRQINTKKYILGMLLFPLTYSSALMAWGFEKMDDQPVRYCNPPTGMHPDVAKCWMITNLVINTAVLALFVVLIIHIKTQGRSMNKADSQRRRRTSRAVRRLLILMAVFIGSWTKQGFPAFQLDFLRVGLLLRVVLHTSLALQRTPRRFSQAIQLMSNASSYNRSTSNSHSPSPRQAARSHGSRDSGLCSTMEIPIISPQQIDALNSIRIGRGTYGTVQKARFRTSPQSEYKNVAIKYANDPLHRPTLIREAKVMHSLQRHPNCIQIFGVYDCPLNGTGVVMEYMDCKSLAELLTNKNIEYKIDHAISWLFQLSNAVDFFHSHDQVHRDLKLQKNIFLSMLLSDRYRCMKLCDFGTFTSMHTAMTCNRGTPITMAPEIFRGENYNTKSDIYSIGIIMWQIISRRDPYPKNIDANVLLWNVCSADKRPPELSCSPVLSLFYKRCWDNDPKVRPTSQECKEYFELLREDYPDSSEPLLDVDTREPIRTPQPNFAGLPSQKSNIVLHPMSRSMLTPNKTHRRAGSDQSTLIRLQPPSPVVVPEDDDPTLSPWEAEMRGTRSQSVADNLSNISSVAGAAAAFAAKTSALRHVPPPPGPSRKAEEPPEIDRMWRPVSPVQTDELSVMIHDEHMAACHQLQVILMEQKEELAKKHHYVASVARLDAIKKLTNQCKSLQATYDDAKRRIAAAFPRDNTRL
ncbi:unnamed protein product [Caenorhabditis auriculariae]|uniref:Mitogen-activated protein kinase kinase kinase n=1 Tax=Caenorhabditis auriculariae TaxID=2777116 RepID=A0A8S1H9N6_9PELO|nr:unnamed protein product [Caenorhabditis auriculariae]